MRIKGIYKTLKTKLQGMAIAFMATLATVIPASAATIAINENTDIGVLIGSIIDFICKIAFYMGLIILITGIVMLVLAYKEDNSEQQTRGVRVIVVGAVLIGLPVLLKTTGIIA